MDILNGFLSGVLKDVACGAINQLQYSFCFNSFAKELQKEEDNLVEMIKNVEDRVIHARRQTLKPADFIDKWLKNANIDSEYVNSLLKETNAKKSCFFGYCPNWIWRYRLGKKLAIKKADLQKIIQEGKQYIQLERIASIPSNTYDILTEKSMNFDSRKYAYDQLMEALKDDGVTMIGLYGMGGCGKTTLAMEVKKIAEAKHLFDTVIFVPVSSTVEVSRIQDKIASSLQYTFPFPENKEKKILMILDDVWEKLDFGRIGIPLSEYHKGRKILITTRFEEVCISMDCQKNIYLPILTDEEAWTLFQEKALMSKDTPETIKHLGILISNECKGLPVAIVVVASSLKGKQEVIWHVALNKLRSSKPINIEKGLRDPYMCLKLSYDNLDTKEARSLFLLCSVFPEDYEIPMECLIRCAIGLGVAEEVETYEEARTEVTAAKIKLVSSCLLLEADDECVKMHDLVRDVAHWIAKNENKIIQCEPKKDVTLEQGSIRYLWCQKFPDDMDCSNLEFLTIKTKLEVSDGIFERMGKLRVLIITNKNDGRMQLSTTSFKSLTNLHCLILQQWNLRDISFVRDMKKLQSLSFHRCSLPSFLDLQTDVTLTTLTNLKLLEFKSCDIESNIFEEIKRIPFLEELYIYKDPWIDSNDESVKFSNSFSVPQKMQRYGIILEYKFYTYYRFQEFFSYERTLGINYFDISNEVIKGLAKKAKELFVRNIKGGAKNMMPDIFEIEEGMNELKELRIGDCEEIECLIDTSNHLSKMENIFSKLRYMEIMDMNHLKTLWHGCLPPNGSFEKLEKLSIEDCKQLTCLFTIDKTKENEDQFTIGHSMQFKIFQNLQEVRIFRCEELKHVFSANITGGLTQLKILTIKICDMLEQIIEEVLPSAHREETNEIVEEDVQRTSSGSFSLFNLEFLEIFSCSMLESLFTTSVAKSLTSLEELRISCCDGLKHIVTSERVKRKKNMVEDEHEFESDLSMFSNLKRVTIGGCDSMQDIFATPFNGSFEKLKKSENQFTNGHSIQSKNFQNLQQVKIDTCKELKHVFSANITGGLTQLKTVTISNCYTLEQIIEEVLPPAHCEETNKIVSNSSGSLSLSSLTYFEIDSCPMLDSLFTTSVAKTLTSLEELRISGCYGLKHIIPPERVKRNKKENMVEDKHEFKSDLSMFSSLKRVTISECNSLQDIFATPFVGGVVNIQNHFPTQQTLSMSNATNGDWMMEQVSLKLEYLKLLRLSQITHIWVATNNSFTLQHLNSLIIQDCQKLEVIFPQSMLRSLPELNYLEVSECKELRQIIEEDLEDKRFIQPCFPKLESLFIEECHKLKCFTSLFASNDLSNLKILIIKEANKLQNFIACEYDETRKTKVELPQLKVIIFMHLLNFQQESIFLNVKHRIIRNCPKLSLTSTITPQELQQNLLLEGLENSRIPDWKIWSLMEEIKKLDEVSRSNNSTELPSLQEVAPATSINAEVDGKSMNFDSRKYASDQLMEALKDDGVTMIGLYGMGGCGKTTLAMEVKKIAEAEHLFDTVIFVPVSSTVEVSRIQDKIASSLQYTFPESQEMERSHRLCMRLTQEIKILMILDDAWEKLDFGRIGIPLSEYLKGHKILITTRSEEVCISMDCQKKIYLPILSDEEAWTLFQEKALMSNGTPENIKYLAKSISNECKGLPVAIVAVASSLKGKQEVIWRAAFNKLRSSKPIKISRGLQDPYMCLKLSYDNLDTEEARSLFLLCSVFPEDYEIPVECLIRCAIGLGVAGEVETYEAARTEVTATKIKLVRSCLLLDADDERVKMHDLVRDVAHWIAKNENKIIKCEVEKDVSLEQGSIRYLWCVKFPDDVDCSNLEFLTIQTKSEVSDGIFERMGKLRVLIITNKNDDRLQLSTTSFKSLTNLHCLILQKWNLRDISFVRDMKKLQSLSFHRCSLPSFLDLQIDVALTTLTNLKLLEFISCDIESNIFEEIKRIPFLEELYIFKDYWNDRKEESVKFSNSFSVPQELQRYGIILEYNFHTHYRFQEFFSCERTLGINYFDIFNEVIKGLAKKVKELFVGNIKGGAKNMMPDIFEIEEGMNELEELKIRYCEEIECLVDTSNYLSKMGNIFSKLRYMEIIRMKHLKTLWYGCLPANGSFEKLEFLFIKDCEQLTCLFTYVIAQRTTKLKILGIMNCNKLKHIIVDDDKTKENEDQFTIGHSMQFKIFQNLQEVIIFRCKELKHVFSTNITGGLTQLKTLTISNCYTLEQIIEEVLPPAHCEETNEIVEEDVQSNSSGSFSLSSLADLKIDSCPMLESLFTTSVAKTLTSLEELKIYNCDGLKHIVTPERVKRKKNMVEDEHEFESDLSMFSNLKSIFIWNCDSMQDIFATPVNGSFEKLKKLCIEDCKQVTCLFTYVIAQRMTELNIKNHFLTQQTLRMRNANNGEWMMGQQVSLKLEYLKLISLPELTHIYPPTSQLITNNSFTLQHLNSLLIQDCQKLEVIFPQSMLRSLPELNYLEVSECKELRQIIEEDLEDKRFIQPCFPKLESLIIQQCHKMKCFSSVLASNDLSNLKILIIKEANKLQDFIACEYDETGKTKVELPQLKLIIFMHLLNFQQESIFLNVKHRIIRNCPKLSLTSTITPQELQQNLLLEALENSTIPHWQIWSLMEEIKKLDEVSRSNNSTELPSLQEMDPTPKNTSPLQMNREDPSISQIKPFSSQVNDNNQSMLESKVEMVGQHNKIETKAPVSEIEEFQKIDRKSEMTSDPEAMEQNFPDISSPNMNERTDEIETDNLGKTTTSDKPAIPTSVSENIEEIGRERSRGGAATEGATIKTFPIGGDNISLVSGVTIHKSSGANILIQDSQVVKQDSEMNEDKTEIAPYQNIKIQEGLNLLDKTEGIGIVSNNDVVVTPDTRTRLEKYTHFVDLNDSQISLLVEAIEAYPHLWNACEKFTDRFRAWMLKTLADMLLFLRSESVGSINREREKEFLKLCDEAVQLGFERSWVDEMRQRVLGRDPKLDHAKVRINELLKRHDHLTWEPDNIKKELRSLNDFLDAQAKCFDFM